MKYIKQIEKLIKYQNKIKDNIATDPAVESIPADLDRKCEEADIWLAEADKKLGEAEIPTMTPNIDPLLDYANALTEYAGMFNHKAQSEIVEFNELVEQLYTEVMGMPSH